MKNKDTGKWHCDFCGESQDETELMIAGPNEMGICNRCVCGCNEIILRQIRTQQAVKPLKQQGGS